MLRVVTGGGRSYRVARAKLDRLHGHPEVKRRSSMQSAVPAAAPDAALGAALESLYLYQEVTSALKRMMPNLK